MSAASCAVTVGGTPDPVICEPTIMAQEVKRLAAKSSKAAWGSFQLGRPARRTISQVRTEPRQPKQPMVGAPARSPSVTSITSASREAVASDLITARYVIDCLRLHQ